MVFGTGGWRAIIGEGFSLANVRRLTQALANAIIRRGDEDCGALIGYDRRFLSDRAAEACAEVFAGNNIPVSFLPEPTPTPLVTFATAKQQAAYGLVFTASHNPPEYNGLKVFAKSGALLLAQETDDIESEANHLGAEDVVRIDLDVGLRSEIVARPTFANDYLDMVESKVDMAAIRAAGLATVIDPMFGVGKATLEVLLTEARCRVLTIHGRHDPLFGGRSPAPDLGALDSLRAAVRDGGFDVGMATDGDADRIAIIDERGEYVDINDLLLLLYFHLRQTRGMRGGVVRNLSTTQMLDRLAAHFGELCVETPVGFKHIVAGMQEHDALLGGESSGGLTIRGHILGKDGILGAALVVEMLAHSGKTVSALLDQVHNITGRLYIVEESIPATPQMRVIIPQRLRDGVTAQIGTHTVESVSNLDGTKVRLGQDHSVLIRFSGTEPVLRIQAEASSREECHELIGHIKAIAGIATA
ncbi:MAG: hypothetical protein A2341_21535 [Deltaproteobacteria bacterium RIFOXYB12_FULL_58_9]|nr:MAG: hypothetical protein A2341_21535 [Deltaproteobacteria bacterium RIFOXYB12_FULL_58_9]